MQSPGTILMASQSKANSLSFTGPFDPFTEYGNWNYVSHNMSRLQIPKCKLKVTLVKYHTSLKKKAFTSHYSDVGGDAPRPKTSD
jgi:hypothetical protein